MISKMLKREARQAKKLFDLCEKYGEGMHGKTHIIDNSEFRGEKMEYRVYHADGYCFDVSKEKIDLAEDETCDPCIGGYEYYFSQGYEGFKEITIEDALRCFAASL